MKAEQNPSPTPAINLVEAPGDEGGLEIGQVLGALRRKALLIVAMATVFACLAQLQASRSKPIYSGGFEILTKAVTVESEVISSVPQTLSSRQQDTSNAATVDATKIRVLLSPNLLSPIIEELKPRYPEMNYVALAGSLSIQTDGGDILTVSYSNGNRELVKDVLNVVSQAYLDYSLEERQKDIRQGIAFVEEQLPQLEARVATQQEKLQQFRQTYNLIDPELQATQYSSQASALAQQQVETQTQLSEAQLLYQELRNQLIHQSSEAAAASALTESPRYQRLLDQLLELDSKLAQDSALYQNDSLEIQVLTEQRQNLLPLLQKEGVRVQQEVASQIQELENRSQALTKSITELNQKIKQLSIITRQYTDIQRELQIATDNLNQFLEKREGLRIDAAQRQVPWVLLTPPPEDPQPSAANVKRSMILGLILGLLLGVGLALALDKLSNVIHTAKEVKDITKLPLLGEIPFNQYLKKLDAFEETISWISAGLDLKSVGDRSPQQKVAAPFLEAFRSLYANLRMTSPDTPIRALIVSSPTPSSGKTTVAIHLAQVAAALGQRVLLVDADLRRPTLHYRLGLMNTSGLTSVISAEVDLLNAVQQVPGEDNLFVITAGPLPPDPGKILSSQSMKNFASKSREMFNLIIYDTPPLLGLADTYLLSGCTDGILLVTRLHQLKRSMLELALEDLRVASAPMLGVVANASAERNDTTYGYYYSRADQPKVAQGLIATLRKRLGR